MKINQKELKAKLISAAQKIVSTDEARYFADEIVETHIRKSPKNNPLKSAIGDIQASISRKDQKLEYKIDLGSYLAIDFHGHGPLLYIKKIHDELEQRANNNGLAMAAFLNSQSMHTVHTWVQGLAKRGIVAIAATNGGPGAVVPFNGTKGLFGTNPLSFGLPGKNGEIHCVDMATSEIPFFEIMAAHENKEPLRERAAVNAKGEFTRNADEALDFSQSEEDPTSNIVPMGGGYKGYYIVYLMEMLTSALIGAPSSPEMSFDFIPEEHGAILLAFSPKAMGTQESFLTSLVALNSAIQSQTPKVGEEIRIPGQENTKRFKSTGDAPIELDDALIEKLDDLSK